MLYKFHFRQDSTQSNSYRMRLSTVLVVEINYSMITYPVTHLNTRISQLEFFNWMWYLWISLFSSRLHFLCCFIIRVFSSHLLNALRGLLSTKEHKYLHVTGGSGGPDHRKSHLFTYFSLLNAQTNKNKSVRFWFTIYCTQKLTDKVAYVEKSREILQRKINRLKYLKQLKYCFEFKLFICQLFFGC